MDPKGSESFQQSPWLQAEEPKAREIGLSLEGLYLKGQVHACCCRAGCEGLAHSSVLPEEPQMGGNHELESRAHVSAPVCSCLGLL